jgi:hypothetical protein
VFGVNLHDIYNEDIKCKISVSSALKNKVHILYEIRWYRGIIRPYILLEFF